MMFRETNEKPVIIRRIKLTSKSHCNLTSQLRLLFQLRGTAIFPFKIFGIISFLIYFLIAHLIDHIKREIVLTFPNNGIELAWFKGYYHIHSRLRILPLMLKIKFKLTIENYFCWKPMQRTNFIGKICTKQITNKNNLKGKTDKEQELLTEEQLPYI